MKLVLNPKDMESFASFEKAVRKQFPNVYVGTDNFTVTLEYPKRLRELLRPYPTEPLTEQTTFEF